ncbi:MAG TPA: hypothetical protein VFU42_02280 [Candidatus Deferrimicrobiaceae bacterium]|nr:hypothetical protein [Candidatus Deferrimicrobiaceae bacterium]
MIDFSPNRLIPWNDRKEKCGPGHWLLGAFLLLCFLSAGPDSPRRSDDHQTDRYVTTWLTKEKAGKIMRYHGTNGIKITGDRVFIKRDGRWICVYRNPSSLPEKQDLEDSDTTALRVAESDS